MTEKIEIIKKLDSSIQLELETFIGKTLKFIHGEYLNFAFEKPEQFSSSNYCQFVFSERHFIYIIVLYPKDIFNKFCGHFPTFEIKVISIKKPKSNREIFYKNISEKYSIFKPCSTVRFLNHKELVLEQLIFFGYDKDTKFISHSFKRPPIEKEIHVHLMNGIIFRFQDNKEIVIHSREDESFGIKIIEGSDKDYSNSSMNDLGWYTEAMFSIGKDS